MASTSSPRGEGLRVFELDPSIPFPALFARIQTALVKLSPTDGEENTIFGEAHFDQLLLNSVCSSLRKGKVMNDVSARVRIPDKINLNIWMIFKPLRICWQGFWFRDRLVYV